jgi:hypothetical protein
VRFFDRHLDSEKDLAVGYSITEPGDDGNFRTYTVTGFNEDGITIEYLSHFDHRTWGKQLIEEDAGTVVIRPTPNE